MRSERSGRAPRQRLAAAGFTLLETMAAVAVLAIVYVTLARVDIVGLRAEGAADRRLRASLVADARLADLEAQLLAGQGLPAGDVDEQAGDFAVRVSVAPFDLTLPAPPEAATKRLRDAKGAGDVARAVAAEAGAAPGQSLFAPAGPGKPSPSRRISVRVSWTEGAAEDSVVRETYALDPEVAAPILEALQAATEQKAGERKSSAAGDATPNVSPGVTSPVTDGDDGPPVDVDAP